MISEREKKILRIIVEEYIKTAKPVSSNHVCDKLNCSSATIRNEMVILEDLKLLEKNHFVFFPFIFSTNKYGITSPKQSVKLGPINDEKFFISK